MSTNTVKTAIAIELLTTIVNRISSTPKGTTLGGSLADCYKIALRVEFKRSFSSPAAALESMEFIQEQLTPASFELLKTIVSGFYLRSGYQNDHDFYLQVAESMLTTALPDEPLPTAEGLQAVLINYKIAVVLYLLTHVLYW